MSNNDPWVLEITFRLSPCISEYRRILVSNNFTLGLTRQSINQSINLHASEKSWNVQEVIFV